MKLHESESFAYELSCLSDRGLCVHVSQGILFSENAVAGEAAALAIGLVFLGGLGSESAPVEELLTHAIESRHEKIIRTL